MTAVFNPRQLMEAITDRTIGFLKEEVDLTVTGRSTKFEDLQRLKLRDLSSLISIGGEINIYIVFSFAEKLITQIFENYTDELDLAPEERIEYMEETAGEMINIIIGNAMVSLQSRGSAIHFSPPIILSEAKRIVRHKHAQFFTNDLDTVHGGMSISIVGPRELFNENLEYI